jgi:hypothetical protein
MAKYTQGVSMAASWDFAMTLVKEDLQKPPAETTNNAVLYVVV